MAGVSTKARQLVSLTASDKGVPLEGSVRALMERCFGTGLDHVRLHFSPQSDAANRALGSLAFAVDHHICFRAGWGEGQGTLFTRVLAHEIAHTIQKRLGIRDR